MHFRQVHLVNLSPEVFPHEHRTRKAWNLCHFAARMPESVVPGKPGGLKQKATKP